MGPWRRTEEMHCSVSFAVDQVEDRSKLEPTVLVTGTPKTDEVLLLVAYLVQGKTNCKLINLIPSHNKCKGFLEGNGSSERFSKVQTLLFWRWWYFKSSSYQIILRGNGNHKQYTLFQQNETKKHRQKLHAPPMLLVLTMPTLFVVCIGYKFFNFRQHQVRQT